MFADRESDVCEVRSKKMEPATNFRDLIVWRKAHQYALAIYKLSATFPKQETYGLASQMRRAAVSAAANIADGLGKRGKAAKESRLIVRAGRRKGQGPGRPVVASPKRGPGWV